MTLAARDGARLTFERGLDAWGEARALGAALRAVGQEPAWSLTVVPGTGLTFVTDYGQRRIATPDPGAQTRGAETVYHAVTESVDLRIVVTEAPCTDAMSAAPYPLTVVVTLGGETVTGCGRRLD